MTRRRALALAALACSAACRGVQSTLDPAGPQAARIRHTWDVFLLVSVVVWVAVVAALAHAVGRNRARTSEGDADASAMPAPLRTDAPTERRSTRVVAVAVALTVATLFGLSIQSYVDGRAVASLPSSDRRFIQVVGHQWWWEVRYRDPDASRTVTTANEIHIPVGQPVTLRMRSNDVIHSFWVPQLHGKRDLIPGQESRLVIQADRPGVYRGQCAEFCGLQHAHMSFVVVAEAPARYHAWLDAQRAAAREPANDAERRGRDVFLARPCVMCHTVRGTGAAGLVGPDLTHLASRHSLAANTLPNDPRHLARWITDPQASKPGNHMPPVPLAPAELDDLVAYLRTLR